jgi:hypothetical protein
VRAQVDPMTDRHRRSPPRGVPPAYRGGYAQIKSKLL